MKFKFLGHACFLVEFGGKSLLFDPFISPNEMAKDIDISQIKPDYILISHAHDDHIADVEQIAKQSGAKIISNFEIVTHYGKKGIDGHPMNHGGKWKFDFGTVKLVNAVHSSTIGDGTVLGHPVGFVIWNNSNCFYFAGDTALTMDMKIIPLTCPNLNIALLPIGDNFTMGYDDAALAAEWVQTKKVIAFHFDTFGYIKIDHKKAIEAFESRNIDLTIPQIGKEINL